MIEGGSEAVYKVKQNNKVRYGKLVKAKGSYVYLLRMFPKTDNEGNIESFNNDKWKKSKTKKGSYEVESELLQIKKTSWAKRKEMVLDLHYGMYEPAK